MSTQEQIIANAITKFGNDCFADGKNEERDTLFDKIRTYFLPDEDAADALIDYLSR